MPFVTNAEEIARTAMAAINPSLTEHYANVIRFLSSQPPTAASAMRGKTAPGIGSAEYVRLQAAAFSSSRDVRSPRAPATIPDEMVSVILKEYFDIPQADLERVKREHSLSMGAENFVGELLERYLASMLEPRGWIWCSGAMVKAADFIKPPATQDGVWRLLQVKNRDNSENSSSSAIRVGTVIEKWHRTFSKRVGSNWAEFPDASLRPHLSEDAFKAYVREYLLALRNLRV
jgi:hypothetical protein